MVVAAAIALSILSVVVWVQSLSGLLKKNIYCFNRLQPICVLHSKALQLPGLQSIWYDMVGPLQLLDMELATQLLWWFITVHMFAAP